MKFVATVIILIIALTVVIDIRLYKRLKQQNRKRLKNALAAFSAVIYSLILTSIACILFKLVGVLATFYWIFFAGMTGLFLKIITYAFFFLAKIPRLFRKSEWHFLKYTGAVLGIFAFGVMWWSALVTPAMLETKEETIFFDNLPDEFDGYKIVQFSDFHAGTFTGRSFIAKNIVKEINSHNPDAILFTGDIVNSRTDEIYPFIPILKELKAKDGVYSVLGNHDYGDYYQWNSPTEKEENLQKLITIERDSLKWNLLNNEHIIIRHASDSIAIVGVENWGEPPFPAYGNIIKAIPDTSTFSLLLSHNPNHWDHEVIGKENIALTLSGHTHAMQTIFRLGKLEYSPSSKKYKYWKGLYQKGKQYLYVNIGCGEVGIPARYGAYPEITIITLKKSK